MKTFTFIAIAALVACATCQNDAEETSLNEPVMETLKAGDGSSFPAKGQTVTAHYRGTLMDGTKFDASYDRNQPFSFKLGVGQVIKCWDFAISKMSIGQKIKVTCPSDWAYGSRGAGRIIPPNSDLIFEVELLSFK
jgi:FKBP-type peptidyl-prolyl cis-trans isomerase